MGRCPPKAGTYEAQAESLEFGVAEPTAPAADFLGDVKSLVSHFPLKKTAKFQKKL